jgi:hypothetical protein
MELWTRRGSGGSYAPPRSLISESFAEAFARERIPPYQDSKRKKSPSRSAAAGPDPGEHTRKQFPIFQRAIDIARQDDAPCEAGLCGGGRGGKSFFPSIAMAWKRTSLHCFMTKQNEKPLDTVVKAVLPFLCGPVKTNLRFSDRILTWALIMPISVSS